MAIFGVAGALTLVACADDGAASIQTPTTVATTTTVEASPPATTNAPSATAFVAAPATTEEPANTPATTVPNPTDPPATSPAATQPLTTTAPPPTPASTQPPEEAPEAPTPLTPAFLFFEVSDIAACPAPDVSLPSAPREVTVTWEVIGTESVYVAIDNVDGPYEAGLAPAGSITLPNSCPNGNTYYVVAENPEGRTVREATR